MKKSSSKKAPETNCKRKDFNSICRVCMKNGNLQSIYKFNDKFENKHQDLSKKLQVCCDVDIKMEDALPSNICDVCSDALLIAYDLKILCQSTDTVLREILMNNMKKTKVKKEIKSYKERKRKSKKKSKRKNHLNMSKIKIENDYSNDEYLNDDLEICHTDYNSDDQTLSQLVKENLQNSIIHNESGELTLPDDSFIQNDESSEMSSGFELKEYKCYACNLAFPTRWERHLHEDVDCPEMPPGTIYKCRLCSATAPDRDKFDKHIWIDHRGTLPPDLERHNAATTRKLQKKSFENDQPLRNIICEKCGMCLKNMNAYQQHCLKHEGKHWLQCDQCNFRAANRHSYNIHIKYRHLGYELLRCDQCSFKTDRKENLKMHQRRHTGERPHQCNICDYRAINYSNLKKHMTKHTNIRAFECKVCGMSYKTNRSLKCHKMRVHENKKMFYCKPCHTKYIGDDAFKRHIEKKHPSDNGC